MYDIINMTHYDRKSQHFTNSINQNTCMVRLPQCTNPCSFILVHAVVLADKLQKFDKLLLALGLHLVFVQTLAVVFQPVQQGVFLSSVARRCPMVALHKSIHLLVIDVPCFFICHVILFWGSSIILRIKFKICKDSHFYLYCQKNTASCAPLLTFSLFWRPLSPPFSHRCFRVELTVQCTTVSSNAIPQHAMPFPNTQCSPWHQWPGLHGCHTVGEGSTSDVLIPWYTTHPVQYRWRQGWQKPRSTETSPVVFCSRCS